MSKYFLGIVLIMVLVMLGCSKTSNPVSDSPDLMPVIDTSGNGRTVIGSYNLAFDPDTMEFSVESDRSAEAFTHFDFTPFLDWCPGGCLKFWVINQDEEGWLTIAAEIMNPSSASVFDPRLLLADLKGKQVKDVDGYTRLFPEVGQAVKPFLAWAKSEPQRLAPAYFADMAFFKLKFTPGSQLDTQLIAECSFGMNIEEPYDIRSFGLIEGELTPDGDTTAKLAVKILDWQDDVEWANINLTQFNGQIMNMDYDELMKIWTVEFENENRLPEGEYNCLIETYSENIWGVSLYKYVKVPVIVHPDPPPTGTQFVYTKLKGMPGMSEIHTMYTGGTHDEQVTDYGRSTIATGVSVNMEKVIFNSDYITPNFSRGFIANWDGTDEVLLYKPSAVSVSSDGTIVLLFDEANEVMWIWNSNTLDFYQLPQTGVKECVMAANTPTIAFVAEGSTMFPEIFSCDLQGAMEMQLTNDGDLTFVKENLSVTDDGLTIAYNAFDADELQSDMEIYTVLSIMPDSQINITENEDIDDIKPKIDGQGRKIVYVSIDVMGSANIKMWDQMAGIAFITDDANPGESYNNPVISSNGQLVLFEKVATLGNLTDIWAYDMSLLPPEVSQVTDDGMSTKPVLASN